MLARWHVSCWFLIDVCRSCSVVFDYLVDMLNTFKQLYSVTGSLSIAPAKVWCDWKIAPRCEQKKREGHSVRRCRRTRNTCAFCVSTNRKVRKSDRQNRRNIECARMRRNLIFTCIKCPQFTCNWACWLVWKPFMRGCLVRFLAVALHCWMRHSYRVSICSCFGGVVVAVEPLSQLSLTESCLFNWDNSERLKGWNATREWTWSIENTFPSVWK